MTDTNHGEMDISAARAAIEAETQRALQIIRAETRAEQASALHDVGSAAVARTLETVKEVRTWLVFFVAALSLAITALSFFGIDMLKSWVAKRTEERLASWLSMDTDAPMRTSLEDLRRRAIVDAYLIHEARTRTRDGRGGVKLTATEVANLLVMLRQPKTDEWEFNGVARVIAYSELDPGLLYKNDELDRVLKTVFESDEFSTSKRCDLLRLWRRYHTTGLIAGKILQISDKHHDVLVQAAFIAASDSNRKAALEYVSRMLARAPGTPGAVAPSEMIGFVLRNDALNEGAWKWMREASANGIEQAPLIHAAAAASICSDLDLDQRISHRYSKEDRAIASHRAAELIAGALRAGVHINSHPNRLETRLFPSFRYQSKSRTEYSAPLDQLSDWLGCSSVVDLALKQRTLSIEAFTSYIEALQVTYNKREIATITGYMSPRGSIEMTDGTNVTGLDTNEPVLLRARIGAGTQLWASWRARNGKYEERQVANIDISNISFAYSFDRDRIYEQVYIQSDFFDESLL